jgi:hypothetical protein
MGPVDSIDLAIARLRGRDDARAARAELQRQIDARLAQAWRDELEGRRRDRSAEILTTR